MPLLWKKAKTTRISRIVADLQSPKRGGSLVVETGFPTSLIDLFVKNRDRLRKPSVKRRKKKNNNNNNSKVNDEEDAENDNRRVDPDPVPDPEPETTPRVPVEENSNVAVQTGGPDVLTAAATIGVLTVAVLALSTRKLAAAFTLSAFALFLIEFVTTRLARRRRSGGGEDSGSESEEEFVASRAPGVRFAEEPPEVKIANDNDDDGGGGDVLVLRPNLEQLSRDKKWGALDPKRDEGVLNKSKRAKIRRKIVKNLVPKKLRSISKKRRKAALMEEESPEVGEEEAEDSVEMSIEDDDGEEQEQEQEQGRHWALVALLGVVLLGLCWGRIFALLLTLVWCFVMKLTGFIRKLMKALRQISS